MVSFRVHSHIIILCLSQEPATIDKTVVCILGSVAEDSNNKCVVPQLPATLTSGDCQMLSELCLPPKWNMNTLNVLQAMYNRVGNCEVSSLVSTPEAAVTRNDFLQQIELLFTAPESDTKGEIKNY